MDYLLIAMTFYCTIKAGKHCLDAAVKRYFIRFIFRHLNSYFFFTPLLERSRVRL